MYNLESITKQSILDAKVKTMLIDEIKSIVFTSAITDDFKIEILQKLLSDDK